MEGHIGKQILITLILNEKEAYWLMSMVQNYQGSDLESEDNKEMREKFFETLREML